jgi:hypothetical protein
MDFGWVLDVPTVAVMAVSMWVYLFVFTQFRTENRVTLFP